MKTQTRSPLVGINLIISGILMFAGPVIGQSAISSDQRDFFESKIRPVLVDSCYECHSKEAGQKKGGLSLDSRFGLRTGGNSGPGVVAGNPEESWIWLAISHTEPDYEMPPKSEKMPQDVLDDFKTWIEMGAPDPREGESTIVSKIDIERGKEFWSFQSPTRRVPPLVENPAWTKTAIDRFVFTKLNSENLKPAKTADAQTLLRRLCFDLIGMPPTAEFSERFHQAWKEDQNKAIESTVDQLLRSQQFGERWGRHWFDVARYAESNGKGSNQAYPHAWRYRDYVIDSFNEDKPYNEFVLEQLAGDLMPATSDQDRQENLIATGFLALGPKDLREKSNRQFVMDMVDEQIDTTSTTFLGLKVSCARCHDHKTDPIPTADYYSLAGIFLSSDTRYGTNGVGGRFNVGELIELPLPGETGKTYTEEEVAEMQKKLVEVNQALSNFHSGKRAKAKSEAKADAPANETMGNAKRGIAKRFRSQKSELEERLGSMTNEGAEKAFAMGMTDKKQAVDSSILVRGEVDSPAQVVPRGFLQVLDHDSDRIPGDTSGRLEMARWIASNRNPLTSRVMVNRVWEKLFGSGLVPSTDNFGKTGQAPTHPELLDHLAIQFMENGWSLKNLVRSLVLTRTYQLSYEFNSANDAKDPENKFLWRAAPKRLDAEAFRDSILAATGQLILERPFRSPIADLGLEELGRKGSPDPFSDFPPYRSVYLPPIRDAMPELIDLFDGADPGIVTGSREISNGAEQSLYLMNSPFIIEQAGHLVEILQKQSDQIGKSVRYAFEQTFGRPPTKGEYESAIQFYQKFVPSLTKSGTDEKEAEYQFLTLFCQGLLSSAEFRYLN